MPVLVSLIGVGLVGQEVIQQLIGLKEFKIYSLSNSKYTISSDTESNLFPLLPSSSSSLPTSSVASIKIEKNDHAALIARLGKNHIIIDCTASLDIPLLYSSALAAGISIVTPNKKGLSSQASLYESIQSSLGHGGLLYCEATVGAGLPIISTLKDLLQTGDKIHKIEGVLSGTLSYIFNEFSTVGGSTVKFSEVVKKAKDLGYTEPHPADDLSGSDVARKLTILSRLINSTSLPSLPEGYASLPTDTLIPVELEGLATGEEFVQRLPEFDAHFDKIRKEAFEDGGSVLRYVGVIDVQSGVVKCSLEKYAPTHPFAASLASSDNIISFTTGRYPVRPLIVQGSGAGSAVTAMGVVADVIKVGERMSKL